jgi:hypothetical protein
MVDEPGFTNWVALDALFADLHGRTLTDAVGVPINSVLSVIRRRCAVPIVYYNVSVKGRDAPGSRGRPNEDLTYAAHPALYDMVPRTMVVRDSDTTPGKMELVYVGIKKFLAFTAVDEDDEGDVDRGGRGGAGAEAVGAPDAPFQHDPRVVMYKLSKKVNGHMFSAYSKYGYIFAGTKKCTGCVASLDAIDGDALPSPMVKTIFQALQTMYTRHGEALMELLRSEVIVGEVQTNQHIVIHPEENTLIAFNTSEASCLFPKPAMVGPICVDEFASNAGGRASTRRAGSCTAWTPRERSCSCSSSRPCGTLGVEQRGKCTRMT